MIPSGLVLTRITSRSSRPTPWPADTTPLAQARGWDMGVLGLLQGELPAPTTGDSHGDGHPGPGPVRSRQLPRTPEARSWLCTLVWTPSLARHTQAGWRTLPTAIVTETGLCMPQADPGRSILLPRPPELAGLTGVHHHTGRPRRQMERYADDAFGKNNKLKQGKRVSCALCLDAVVAVRGPRAAECGALTGRPCGLPLLLPEAPDVSFKA